MELKKTLRSGALLLELMAAILIFALAGSICIQVLVKADATVRSAGALRTGVSRAQSAAEILRSAPNHEAGVQALEECLPCRETEGLVSARWEDGGLEITWQEKENIYYYNIVYSAEAEPIYTLTLVRGEWEVAP